MGIEIPEILKAQYSRVNRGYTGMQLIFGAIMVAIGVQYQDSAPCEAAEGSAVLPSDCAPCPNGAAHYLFVTGVTLLVTAGFSLLGEVSSHLANKDGKVTCAEGCGLCFLKVLSALMGVVDTCLLIWGSVVVLGSWSSWTDNYEEYQQDPTKYNYCAHTPMKFAFVILVLKWVLIPLLMILVCCLLTCCAACLAGKAASEAKGISVQKA